LTGRRKASAEAIAKLRAALDWRHRSDRERGLVGKLIPEGPFRDQLARELGAIDALESGTATLVDVDLVYQLAHDAGLRWPELEPLPLVEP